MNPITKEVSPFTVAGISVRTTNRDESSPGTAQLGALWGRFFQEQIAGQIPNQVAGSAIYGVYSDYESDVNGAYTVTAGVQVDPDSSAGDEFTSVDVASSEYLVFEGKGLMPQVVIDTWKAVWEYFANNHEYKRAYTTDFEL
jgi:predicted transcriptional regulator YdeE